MSCMLCSRFRMDLPSPTVSLIVASKAKVSPTRNSCDPSTPVADARSPRFFRYTYWAVRSTPLPRRYSQFGRYGEGRGVVEIIVLLPPCCHARKPARLEIGTVAVAHRNGDCRVLRAVAFDLRRKRECVRALGPRSLRSSTTVFSGLLLRLYVRAAISAVFRSLGEVPMTSRRWWSRVIPANRMPRSNLMASGTS